MKIDSPDPQVFIIKDIEDDINWNKLSLQQQIDLLIYNSQDLINSNKITAYTLESFGKLINEYRNNKFYDDMLYDPTYNSAMIFFNFDWITPIISDTVLIYNESNVKDPTDKLVNNTYKLDKIKTANLFSNNVVDIVSNFEYNSDPHAITLRSTATKFVDRYSSKSIEKIRWLVENELVNCVGFNVNVLFENKNNKNQKKGKKGIISYYINSTNELTIKESLKQIVINIIFKRVYDKIEAFESYNMRNIYLSDFKIHNIALDKPDKLPKILINEMEKRFPSWLLVEQNILITNIYGKYKSITGSLGDNSLQRIKWLNKNYFGSIPFYILIAILSLMTITPYLTDDEHNKQMKENYLFIKEIFDQKYNINNNINNKLNDYFKKICAKIDKDVYQQIICNENDLEDRLNYIRILIDKMHYFIIRGQLRNNKLQNELIQKQKDIEIKNDNIIVSQAIAKEFTPYVLKKKQLEAQNKYLTMRQTLTTEEERVVNKYIEYIHEFQVAWNKNKCPHFNIRNNIENTVIYADQIKLFENMFKKYGTEENFESKKILCNNCGFNLGCEHERIFVQLFNNSNPDYKEKYNKIIEDNYYSKDHTDAEIIYIFCKFCGRKIKDATLEKQIIFEENSDGTVSRNFGNVVETDENEIRIIRNVINKVLFAGQLSTKINYWNIYTIVKSYLIDAIKRIAKSNISNDQQNVLQEITVLSYVYAAIFREIINSGYRINFPIEFLNKTFDIKSKEVNQLIYTALLITKLNDVVLFNQMILYKYNLAIFIANAFEILKRDSLNKSDIENIFRLHHIENISEIIKSIKNYENNKEDNLTKLFITTEPLSINDNKIKKLLLINAQRRLEELSNLRDIHANDPQWSVFVNDPLMAMDHKLYTVWSQNYINPLFNRLIMKTNIPEFPYETLTLTKKNTNELLYNPLGYNLKTGAPQKWNIVHIDGITINEKILKEKISAQKIIFDMNENINNLPKYYRISDNVNLTNISMFKKQYSNSQGEFKHEVKENMKKMNAEEYARLKDKAFDYNMREKIRNQVIRSCLGNLSYEICYNELCILCGLDVNYPDSLIDDVCREILKQQRKINKPKKLIEYSLTQFNLTINESELTIDNEQVQKLIAKLLYFDKSIDNNKYYNIIANLGKLIKIYEDNYAKITPETEKRIKYNINLNRINNLINLIKRLEQYYHILGNNNSEIYLVSLSQQFLKPFIVEKKSADFKIELPKRFKQGSIFLNEIRFTKQFSGTKKINLLINLFVELCLFIIRDSLSAQFIIKFLNIIENEYNIVDISEKEMISMQEDEDKNKRARMEIFYKSTPEEKILRNLMLANYKEDQSIFEQLMEEQDAEAPEIVPREDKFDMDDEIDNPKDDDAIYINNAFDFL